MRNRPFERMSVACIYTASFVPDSLRESLKLLFDKVYSQRPDPRDTNAHLRLIRDYRIKIYLDRGEYIEDKKKQLYVDYLHAYGMSIDEIISKTRELRNNFYARGNGNLAKSVAVFDLDDTLIDDQGMLLTPIIPEILCGFRKIFTFIVMWSHGNTEHVEKYRTMIEKMCGFKFDLIINRYITTECANKGLGGVLRHLNIEHGVTRLSTTCLIDDLSCNFSNDYLFFIEVPKCGDYERFFRYALDKLHKRIVLTSKTNNIKAPQRIITNKPLRVRKLFVDGK